MSLSELPLSFCANVLPGRTVAEIESGLERHAVPIRDRLGGGMSVGLWFARSVIDELMSTNDGVRRFTEKFAALGLVCHTLNAFPYGDFHGPRVKEGVYVPDWTQPERLWYTERCATVLAELLPEGGEGSISTLPLGFKGGEPRSADFVETACRRLIELAAQLSLLRQTTGKLVRIGIEPEPCCLLETTEEAINFFNRLWHEADVRGLSDPVREHIGLCYDVCHQAVEFEDMASAIRDLDRAGVRINKVHISSALRLEHPAANLEGRSALQSFVEPRYLHQTLGRLPDGRVVRSADLTRELLNDPGADLLAAAEWRVHFHVPVNQERIGPLGTTRPALREALEAVARLDYAPHLEVETYTWSVLPGESPPDLVSGLTEELAATRALLSEVRSGLSG